MRRLPPGLRHLFKRPFGRLYPDFADILPVIAGRTLYTVGDIVTARALSFGIIPSVMVVDGMTMRRPVKRPGYPPLTTLSVKNPAGTITDTLIAALEQAVAHPPVRVEVDGEEDLAVIPLVIVAPDGAMVIYGQPGEGVVVREVDGRAKEAAQTLFAQLEVQDDSI
ncbi:MAG: GTP-dependent dephospho-CoA kinase family protein [Methanomicrobiales archaeon]|jgi:hypothetical protein|nr:GTP-dependent dephospho-CoA kinase family protein [Methanomicrobiales archaeon]